MFRFKDAEKHSRARLAALPARFRTQTSPCQTQTAPVAASTASANDQQAARANGASRNQADRAQIPPRPNPPIQTISNNRPDHPPSGIPPVGPEFLYGPGLLPRPSLHYVHPAPVPVILVPNAYQCGPHPHAHPCVNGLCPWSNFPSRPWSLW